MKKIGSWILVLVFSAAIISWTFAPEAKSQPNEEKINWVSIEEAAELAEKDF